ncbi:M23 family metallopeptidase, partial [Sphingomonas endophytica]
ARVEKLPAPRPAWEARAVTADARLVRAQEVVVRPGDTLTGIADRTGASPDAIARRNALAPPFALRVGQRLEIPGGRYHRVDPGQTGIGIARAYGVPWSQVIAANALTEPYILKTGQRVLIPATAPSAAARAAAFSLDIDTILTGGEPAVAAGKAPARPTRSAKAVPPSTVPVASPVTAPGRFAWPVDGRIIRRFGAGASGERFDGVEIAVPTDTPVRASANGTVVYAGDGIAALGGLVIVKHGDTWTSIYGHARKLLVRRGQAVTRGQVIAISGATGFADRPQLHFELRRGRTPVDPVSQLPRR